MSCETESSYGTGGEESHVMSEKVQALAASVYQEFERLMHKYDESVVKDLMPLVVNILETLDQTFTEKQENDVELELLRDDSEQLLTQYEREKQLRKNMEQRCLELEDQSEEERQELQAKLDSLESNLRMFELKTRNAQDHISRLEDKDNDTKKEYNKLHERYTELFKTHMDYMERAKMMIGGDRITDSPAHSGSNRPKGFGNVHLRPVGLLSDLSPANDVVSPTTDIPGLGKVKDASSNLSDELQATRTDRSQLTDSLETRTTSAATDATSVSPTATTPTAPAPSTAATSTVPSSPPSEPLANSLNHSASTSPAWTTPQPTPTYPIPSPTPPPPPFNNLPPTSSNTPPTPTPPTSANTSPPSAMPSAHSVRLPSPKFTIPQATYVEDDIQDEIAREPSPEIVAPEERSREKNLSSLYDELLSEDVDALGDMDEGAEVAGMSKEVENLILENTELLATKNALNIVKDDLICKVDQLSSEQEILREEINSLQGVRDKLKERINELEADLKRTREELKVIQEKTSQDVEEEGDLPMAQRKRFTRVEMARVLMERNQYKERLMELQEAVRWTEMIRASKEHPDLQQQPKNKGSIWNLFSHLFSSSAIEKPKVKRGLPVASIRYAPPGVQPVGDPNRTARDKYNLGERAKAYNFLQDDVLSEKARQERERERRDQYKQVRAHVQKQDGRLQAYGWSLPAKVQSGGQSVGTGKSTPVPVPIFCGPITAVDNRVWCAAVSLVADPSPRQVGQSVFYCEAHPSTDKPSEESDQNTNDDVERLNKELQDRQRESEAANNLESTFSSLVWLCTCDPDNGSHVTIVDVADNQRVVDSFPVASNNILCISCIPDVSSDDLILDDVVCDPHPSSTSARASEASGVSGITYLQCLAGTGDHADQLPQTEVDGDEYFEDELTLRIPSVHSVAAEAGSPSKRVVTGSQDQATVGLNAVSEEADRLATKQQTMWLGTQSGSLYVHSAVDNFSRCLASVKLKDSVIDIVHLKGRVFVALANGTVAVFHRDTVDGSWRLLNYHVVTLGGGDDVIRCLTCVTAQTVWCGCRNVVHVLSPKTLRVEASFEAHPRGESQVRGLVAVGDGVWVSLRLDSTLRLYHAHNYKHLQDVDIEPYVSKMLGTGKLGFSFVRITALHISCKRLWIGTGNGVIISVPLSDSNKQAVGGFSSASRPGGLMRVYGDSLTPVTFTPYCSMAQAQLSFHGHKDSVKFFISARGLSSGGLSGVLSTSTQDVTLVISAGDGYVDFRTGDLENCDQATGSKDKSHMIIWQVSSPK